MICTLCGSQFESGPGRQGGKTINRYRITVCRTCWDANWNGWAPLHEQKLIEHLKQEGLPVPVRNVVGQLPRE
jgi:hypothetical protein